MLKIEIQQIENGFILEVFNSDPSPDIANFYCKTLKEVLEVLPKRLKKVDWIE